MATFSFKSFAQLLQDMIDEMTANASTVTNFGEGSVVRVLFESVCGRMDYFTQQLKKILRLCRLATSSGDDVDSFTDDFGMDSRLAATKGRGSVTFSRLTISNTTVFIPVGTLVLAFDDSVEYEVVADSTNVNYDSTNDGYFIASNQASVIATVEAVTAGTIGNVAAATLTVLGSSVPGVDTVTNATEITNALDAETDAEMRDRFVDYIDTRARATEKAIRYSADIVQNNLTYVLRENIDVAGNEKIGNFVLVVDDGTGTPSEELLEAVAASVELYRGFTITYNVIAPEVLSTNASCNITADTGYVEADLQDEVEEAITSYLNSLAVGQFLDVDRIDAIALGVTGVKSVTSSQLNGGSSDITPTFKQVIKAGTVTVS